MCRAARVIGVWQGGNGALAEVVYCGEHGDIDQRWRAVDSLVDPVKKIAVYIEMSDGSRVRLPFLQMAEILPNGGGVVAVFAPGQYLSDEGFDKFSPPDNAAVFNLDGSLRFVVRNPFGAGTSFQGFTGGTFDIVTEVGEFRIAVIDDDPSADFVYSFLYDGVSPDIKDEKPLRIRL